MTMVCWSQRPANQKAFIWPQHRRSESSSWLCQAEPGSTPGYNKILPDLPPPFFSERGRKKKSLRFI